MGQQINRETWGALILKITGQLHGGPKTLPFLHRRISIGTANTPLVGSPSVPEIQEALQSMIDRGTVQTEVVSGDESDIQIYRLTSDGLGIINSAIGQLTK